MAELVIPPPPSVGQLVHVTRSAAAPGNGGAYRVTEVQPTDTGGWTYTLEPVTDETEG